MIMAFFLRWAFVSEGDSVDKANNPGGPPLVNGNSNQLQQRQQQQDFVPYVVRVAKLLLQKVS